jgi:hypothetical protein
MNFNSVIFSLFNISFTFCSISLFISVYPFFDERLKSKSILSWILNLHYMRHEYSNFNPFNWNPCYHDHHARIASRRGLPPKNIETWDSPEHRESDTQVEWTSILSRRKQIRPSEEGWGALSAYLSGRGFLWTRSTAPSWRRMLRWG